MVFRKFISNRNEKSEVKMKKPVYLGLSILEVNKTLMYKFWYDFIKIALKDRAAIFDNAFTF